MKLSHVLRAVGSSWLAVFVNAVVGFLLTPYVLHHLGDVEFGLYTLVTMLTGYYGLFDLGVRSAILRFVSRALALNDHDEINCVISTAFYFYWGICVLAILTTIFMLPWMPRLFGANGETARAFQYLFLLAGIVQGLILPLNVFAASVDASGRFDQVYMVQIFSLLLRVVFLVVAIHAGGHLFAVGAVVLLSMFLSYVFQIPLALRQIHGISLNPKWVRRSKLRELFRYSSVTIGIGLGEKVKAYISPVLVGLLMNPAAVTLFSLPTKLLRFPVDGIGTMTEVVNPASSHLEAHEDYVKLRRLLQLSVQGAFILVAPMSAFLLIYGRDLLRLWVGVAYLSAYPLLVVLTLVVDPIYAVRYRQAQGVNRLSARRICNYYRGRKHRAEVLRTCSVLLGDYGYASAYELDSCSSACLSNLGNDPKQLFDGKLFEAVPSDASVCRSSIRIAFLVPGEVLVWVVECAHRKRPSFHGHVIVVGLTARKGAWKSLGIPRRSRCSCRESSPNSFQSADFCIIFN